MTYAVIKKAAGTPYAVSNTVLNAAGASVIVNNTVLDIDSNPFAIFTATVTLEPVVTVSYEVTSNRVFIV